MIVDLPTPEEPTSATAGPHVRLELIHAAVLDRAQHVHGDADGDSCGLGLTQCRRVAQVGLGQHDDRLRATVPDHRQVAFEPAAPPGAGCPRRKTRRRGRGWFRLGSFLIRDQPTLCG